MAATGTSSKVYRWLGAGVGAAAAAYGVYAGMAWLHYGHVSPAAPGAEDPLLDCFMPHYDIAERHHIHIDAPAGITLAAACDTDLQRSPVVRAIFRAREILLGASPDAAPRPRALVASMTSLGWVPLAEIPGRELVMGAVTRPWEADVIFRGLPPAEFAAFDEPGYVKIAWTLRADPAGAGTSIFRTETRATATDAIARTRFRRYWALLSPGIVAIRLLMLEPIKADAERRAARERRDAVQQPLARPDTPA